MGSLRRVGLLQMVGAIAIAMRGDLAAVQMPKSKNLLGMTNLPAMHNYGVGRIRPSISQAKRRRRNRQTQTFN